MAISVAIIGIDKAIAMIKKKERGAIDGMNNGMNKATLLIWGEVKESISGHRAEPTSVDTGLFLNTVGINNIEPETREIFSPLEYAKHLEYGTSSRNGRYHFKNTADRNRSKVIEIIKKEIKSAVESA